uniref:Uncharacterized protein n=1 Tax=Anopheles braziliensis TaxID=58242 RepID=A0A2M3YYH7_9DIPT
MMVVVMMMMMFVLFVFPLCCSSQLIVLRSINRIYCWLASICFVCCCCFHGGLVIDRLVSCLLFTIARSWGNMLFLDLVLFSLLKLLYYYCSFLCILVRDGRYSRCWRLFSF